MDCNETRRLLAADLDGELDLVRHLELEQHLSGCARCAELAGRLRSERTAMRDVLPRYHAPAALAGAILSAIQAESRPADAAPIAPRASAPPSWHWLPPWVGIAAGIAAAAVGGFAWGNASARRSELFDEAVADHVRSLQADHLLDVVSTDQHTVKPWFSGKLDFSPPVVDLASAGFPLGGGRLEHLDGRPAAALVYHRRQHAINLFVWPAEPKRVRAESRSRDGYQEMSWTEGDLNFLAVSEIPAPELESFAARFRSATAAR